MRLEPNRSEACSTWQNEATGDEQGKKISGWGMEHVVVHEIGLDAVSRLLPPTALLTRLSRFLVIALALESPTVPNPTEYSVQGILWSTLYGALPAEYSPHGSDSNGRSIQLSEHSLSCARSLTSYGG